MKIKAYKRYNIILNTGIALLLLLLLFSGLALLGNGGVLNELEGNLLEIQALEEKGLLNNPPVNTSSNTKAAILSFQDSNTLKAYILKTKKSGASLEKACLLLLTSLLLLIIAKIMLTKLSLRDKTSPTTTQA